MKNKKPELNKAFTLIETIIAIFIMAVAMGSLLTLAANGYYSVRYARNQIVADNLVQEAVEKIRNVRDTTFYMPASEAENQTKWENMANNTFTGCFTPDGCIVDIYTTTQAFRTCSGTCPTLTFYSNQGIYAYTYGYPFGSSGAVNTSYVRTIKMNYHTDYIEVNVRVSWLDGGRNRSISQDFVLTNWRANMGTGSNMSFDPDPLTIILNKMKNMIVLGEQYKTTTANNNYVNICNAQGKSIDPSIQAILDEIIAMGAKAACSVAGGADWGVSVIFGGINIYDGGRVYTAGPVEGVLISDKSDITTSSSWSSANNYCVNAGRSLIGIGAFKAMRIANNFSFSNIGLGSTSSGQIYWSNTPSSSLRYGINTNGTESTYSQSNIYRVHCGTPIPNNSF